MLIYTGICSSVAIADRVEVRPNNQAYAKTKGNVWNRLDKDLRQKLSLEDLDELPQDTRIFMEKGVEIPRHYHFFDGGEAQ